MKRNYAAIITKKAEEKPQALIGKEFSPISIEEARTRAAEAVNATPVYLDKNGKPRKPNKKSEGLSYEEWEKRLDALVQNKIGLSMLDCADWNSMDAFEEDLSVAEGFRAFVEEQDFLD
jgi:hypothetical protein